MMDDRYQSIYNAFKKKEIISASEANKIVTVTTVSDAIATINSHIKKDGLRLIKTRDEQTGVSYLLLKNVVKSHIVHMKWFTLAI